MDNRSTTECPPRPAADRPCCPIGRRGDVGEIDAALRAGASLSTVAKRFDVVRGTLGRHRLGCLQIRGDILGTARDAEETHAETSVSPFRVPNPGDDSSTTPRKVVAAMVEREAVRLRAKGLSYEAIGIQLHVDPETALDAVERVLIRTRLGANEQADAARRLDLERIDQLLASLWERATDPKMAVVDVPADTETGARAYDGQDKAVDRVTKLLERRAKLLGLDAGTGTAMPFYLAPGFDEFLGVLLAPLERDHPEALAAAMDAARDHIAMLAAAKPARPGLRLVSGGRSA